MHEFIEGAAYVSPSRNKVYIYAAGQLHSHQLIDDLNQPSFQQIQEILTEEENDLVVIWAPGEPVSSEDQIEHAELIEGEQT